MTTNEMTPADIAAVTGGGSDRNSGWGGDWSAWIVVFLIFAMFGWGGNGFGGFGGNGASSALTRSDLCQDMNFQALEGSVRGVQQGLCDGFYAQNTNMLNGFGSLQNGVNQGFAGLNSAIITNGYETRNAVSGIGNQMQQCCCDIREGISGVNYNIASNTNAIQHQISDCCCETQRQIERGFCDTNYNMATNTTAIVQNAHNDTDRILGKLNEMESARQQEKISQLQTENQRLRFDISQQAQNAYLVNTLNPPATPSYIVCNPNTGRYGYGGCNSCNNGCAC